ncbi:MAG: hypothetical protein R6V27_07560 [Balneolaceae bacterium]
MSPKIFYIFLLVAVLFIFDQPAAAQDSALNAEPVGGTFSGASSLSITPSGTVYITEQRRNRFLVLSQTGQRIDSLGASGSGDYRFDHPLSIDATNGLRIYVADRNNGRVQLFDRRLQYLSSISASKIPQISQFRPERIATGSGNELLVYDSDHHIIFTFDHNGNYDGEIDLRKNQVGEVSQMKANGSELLLLDSVPGVVHRFEAIGAYKNFIGGFRQARAIYPSEDRIWAAYPGRIVEHGQTGNRINEYTLQQEIDVVDMAVYRNNLYLLTQTQLFTARIP